MGKKTAVSSSSLLKISKTTDNKKVIKQPPLNNLISVLRPKVYITDSSAFKTLVQQLTGNGNHQNTPTTTVTTTVPPHDHHQMIHKGVSIEALFDTSLSSSPSSSSLSNQHAPDNPNQVFYDGQLMVNLDDVTKTMEQSSSSSSPASDISADDHHLTTAGWFDDLLAYDGYQHDDMTNHAPWLVDLDHVEPSSSILSSIPLVDSCVASSSAHYFLEQDVSIYDYELSGLLM